MTLSAPYQDGDYKACLRTRDAAGNLSPTVETATVTWDRIAPEVTHGLDTVLGPDSTFGPQTIFALTVSDGLSGIAGVKFSLKDTQSGLCIGSGSASIDAPCPSWLAQDLTAPSMSVADSSFVHNRRYELTAEVLDAAGNTTLKTHGFRWADAQPVSEIFTTVSASADVDATTCYDRLPSGHSVLGFQMTESFTYLETSFSTRGLRDAYLVAFNPDMSPRWIKRAGSSGDDMLKACKLHAADLSVSAALEVKGVAAETVTIAGQDMTAIGQRDLVFVRLDADGSFRWGGVVGTTGNDEHDPSLDVFSNGDIVVSANLSDGSTAYDFFGTSIPGSTSLIARLAAADGSPVWIKHAHPANGEHLLDVTVGPSGSVYATGSAYGVYSYSGSPAVIVSPAPSSSGTWLSVVKFDGNSGAVQWHRFFQASTGWVWPSEILEDSDHNVVIAGGVDGWVSLDNDEWLFKRGGPADFFTLKLDGSTGAHIWNKVLNTVNSYYDWGNSLAIGPDNAIYQMLSYKGSLHVDDQFIWGSDTDWGVALVRYDSDGRLVWLEGLGAGLYSGAGYQGVGFLKIDENSHDLFLATKDYRSKHPKDASTIFQFRQPALD